MRSGITDATTGQHRFEHADPLRTGFASQIRRPGTDRRSSAWPGTLVIVIGARHRRTVHDYERLPGHHETYIYWAMITVSPHEFSSGLLHLQAADNLGQRRASVLAGHEI